MERSNAWRYLSVAVRLAPVLHEVVVLAVHVLSDGSRTATAGSVHILGYSKVSW